MGIEHSLNRITYSRNANGSALTSRRKSAHSKEFFSLRIAGYLVGNNTAATMTGLAVGAPVGMGIAKAGTSARSHWPHTLGNICPPRQNRWMPYTT
jgi:hypothetical protein